MYAAGPDPAKWGRAIAGWPPRSVVVVDHRVSSLDAYPAAGVADVYRYPVPATDGEPVGRLREVVDLIAARAHDGGVIVAGYEAPVAATVMALMINAGHTIVDALSLYESRGTAYELPFDWRALVENFAMEETPPETRARHWAAIEQAFEAEMARSLGGLGHPLTF
ncbi:hypothetical protein ACU686_26185 [Yinghuangia aomiensis]